MADPIIKISSLTGVAEPNASGAGPSVAVKGVSNATSNGATPSVISLGGSPDLSGVASDGSHVIYLQTVSGRRFCKITAVDNSAKTVTVEDTITGANCTNRSWAIGGTLSTLFGTGYIRLVDDGTNPEAKGGWILELQSGHVETTPATTTIRGGGSVSSSLGVITLKAVDGAATRPVLTVTGSNGFTVSSLGAILKGFDVRNNFNSATSVLRLVGDACSAYNMVVYSTGSPRATTGVVIGSASRAALYHSAVYECLTGVSIGSGVLANCYVYDCTTAGVSFSTSTGYVSQCVVVDCGIGISTTGNVLPTITHNVVDTCTTGISYGSNINAASSLSGMVHSNLMANCTTGLHFAHASATEVWSLYGFRAYFSTNGFYNNTSHLKYNATTSNDVTPWDGFVTFGSEPFLTATKATRKTNGDWRSGTALKETGFPQTVVGLMALTRNYVDLGIQRQEASSSSTVIVIEG